MLEHNQIQRKYQAFNNTGYLWGILSHESTLTFIFITKGTESDLMEVFLNDLKSTFMRANLGDWKTCEQLALQNTFEEYIQIFLDRVNRQLKGPQRARSAADTI
jgi:hypothetical protein